ncbi:MAG: hypothetical protein DRG40_06100 [Deltaproteobacteria bacterium]|nr:MAG: hypothetical protein DRG40_06100 [Deltaproteobacteria bacterium]
MKEALRSWLFFSLLVTVLSLGGTFCPGGEEVMVNPSFTQQREIYRFIQGFHTGLDDREEWELARIIVDESRRYGLDPELVLAMILVESSFYHRAKSAKGARGLMQLRPFVARVLAKEMGIPWQGKETILDPSTNVRLGLHYLSKLILRFRDLKLAIAAYNYGPSYVKEQLRRGKPVPTRYAERVLRNYRLLSRRLSLRSL